MKYPLITVYVISNNYGRYARQAIESIFRQTYKNIQLILINDGSKDQTGYVFRDYSFKAEIYENEESLGFVKCCNQALKKAKGKYIFRLDADDWLDENFISVLVNYMELETGKAFVYPDYYTTDENGVILDNIRVVDKEFLLDIPAHGACTMYRTNILKSVGGYDKDIKCQDGYDLWLKIASKYEFGHVKLPLFYYRQHSRSITRGKDRLINQRREIKKKHIESNKIDIPKTAIIIPFRKNSYAGEKINGKRMIEHTIERILESKLDKEIILSSADNDLMGECYTKYPVSMHLRHNQDDNLSVEEVTEHCLHELNIGTQNIMVCHYHFPFLGHEAIDEAIYTKSIYNSKSVVSLSEDINNYYSVTLDHKVQVKKRAILKKNREHKYKESGSIYLMNNAVARSGSFVTDNTSFILLTEKENFEIDNDFKLSVMKGDYGN